MKKQALMSMFVVVMGVFLFGLAATGFAADPEIIGAPKCKMCHKAKTGDQWAKWEAGPHAKAFEALGTDAAKEAAAAAGLGDPQTEPACLKCHTTHHFLGTDVKLDAKGKYELAEGVGCEACHGAGSEYKSKKVMEDREASIAAGMNLPGKAEFCTKCHNEESPTFKGFDYDEYYAKIAHPIPAET
jgi:hypothetical protein